LDISGDFPAWPDYTVLLMNILEFSSLVYLGSLLAGFLGASTGLGGGVVIVPLLTPGSWKHTSQFPGKGTIIKRKNEFWK